MPYLKQDAYDLSA